MTLYFIGIGLNDEKDISIKGLEAVKNCKHIYLESYTSKLNCPISKLEELYNKKIIPADRELVEKKAETTILEQAKTENVAFLVIGDVFSATTHIDLLLRAKKTGIETKIIHNASILTAVGIVGLELYKYGRVASIPFHNKDTKSPIEILKNNQKLNLHTLFLLDLEPVNNKFLSIKDAVDYLIRNGIDEDTKAVACAQLGSEKPFIKYAKLSELKDLSVDKYPQCLIIPGKLHFMEEEALNHYI